MGPSIIFSQRVMKKQKKPAAKRAAKNLPSKKKSRFPVVCIGGSAGSLEPIQGFFSSLPLQTGMAFIVLLHQDSSKKSLLTEIIRRKANTKVQLIKDGMKVSQDCIYISPPKCNINVFNGKFYLGKTSEGFKGQAVIDFLFSSVSQEYRENAIGVIMSGMGRDGSMGIRKIKEEGGLSIVQDPESSKFSSMPEAVCKNGMADYVLEPSKMPEKIISYIKQSGRILISRKLPLKSDEIQYLQRIFLLIRNQTGNDFSGYKINTLMRRIERRMAIHEISDISRYVRYLKENKSEVDLLGRDFLINVTRFFRDPPAFDALKKRALLPILRKKKPNRTFRVWVPGCSSGEEAYSVAIVINECLRELKLNIDVQVFATDIDREIIKIARRGTYQKSIESDIGPERLSKYFSQSGNELKINKSIREMLVFAPHNIIKDPPFTELDMICCRNLLIYLQRELQARLFPRFQYSLKENGILFLGTSESLGSHSDIFSVIDKKWKIYKRGKELSRKPMLNFRSGRNVGLLPAPVQRIKDDPVAILADRTLLRAYAPPSVIVNASGQILYVHGRTGKYLELAPGGMSSNIVSMAKEGLKTRLLSSINKAARSGSELICKNIEIESQGERTTLSLHVKPIEKLTDSAVMLAVSFIETAGKNRKKEETRPARKTPGKNESAVLRELRKELQETGDSLKATIEELETTNEEFKSTNEELQSTNEELQSTNEELETSREEHQSMNEELTIINSELETKIEDLTKVNDDLKNLLSCVDYPVIFLDSDLRIRRFSSMTEEIIRIIPSDVGRKIEDISTVFQDVSLRGISETVLKDLACREKELITDKGIPYNVRVSPYRTKGNLVDGVIISFKKTDSRSKRLASVLNASNDAIILHDLKGNILEWNRGASKAYGYTEREALMMNISQVTHPDKAAEYADLIKYIRKGKTVDQFKTRRVDKRGRVIDTWITATVLYDEKGDPIGLATTERDVNWLA